MILMIYNMEVFLFIHDENVKNILHEHNLINVIGMMWFMCLINLTLINLINMILI